MTSATCTFTANKMKDLLDISQADLAKKVTNLLTDANIQIEQVQGLKQVLTNASGYSKACAKFSSTKKLDKYVASNYAYLAPIEYVLGMNENGKNDTYQYVPILNSIEALLKHEGVLAQVIEDHVSHDGKLRDICDGSKIKESTFFFTNPTALKIILYYDDFVVSNPLGNKTRKYKIGAFYFVLANLKPRYRSRLIMIPLVALCKNAHIQKYGMDAILRPLISDFKKLENDGMLVEFEGKTFHFHGTLVAIVADNLAAHALGNFYQNFSTSLRLCRFCNVTNKELLNVFHEGKVTLRTIDAHDNQANRIERMPHLASVYGFKGHSCLKSLDHFHIIQGIPFDIAHDVLEGLVPEVIGNVIVSLVSDGFLTLSELNEIVLNFPYQDSDKNNKPQPFATKLYNFKVKLTAAECWCLIRLLPLMIGNYIEKGHPIWEVLLDLCDIVELIFAPEYSKADILYMKEKIEEFHVNYHGKFPNENMKPKGHYTLHYGTLTAIYGPLIHLWTLRFESKHNYFKGLMHCTKKTELMFANIWPQDTNTTKH